MTCRCRKRRVRDITHLTPRRTRGALTFTPGCMGPRQRPEVTPASYRRADLLDRMADFLLSQGLAATSLLPLAKAAGISDRSLLYFFEERSKVITAILTLPSLRLKTRLDIRTIIPPLPLAGCAAGW